MKEDKKDLTENTKAALAALNKPARKRWVMLAALVVVLVVLLTMFILHESAAAPLL